MASEDQSSSYSYDLPQSDIPEDDSDDGYEPGSSETTVYDESGQPQSKDPDEQTFAEKNDPRKDQSVIKVESQIDMSRFGDSSGGGSSSSSGGGSSKTSSKPTKDTSSPTKTTSTSPSSQDSFEPGSRETTVYDESGRPQSLAPSEQTARDRLVRSSKAPQSTARDYDEITRDLERQSQDTTTSQKSRSETSVASQRRGRRGGGRELPPLFIARNQPELTFSDALRNYERPVNPRVQSEIRRSARKSQKGQGTTPGYGAQEFDPIYIESRGRITEREQKGFGERAREVYDDAEWWEKAIPGIIEARVASQEAGRAGRNIQNRVPGSGGFVGEPVYNAAQFGLGAVEGITAPVAYPRETFVETPARVVTNPGGTASEIQKAFRDNEYRVVGQFAGGLASEEAAVGLIRGGRNIYTRVGSREVPSESVFSGQVLDEGKTFPTVRSLDEAERSFANARLEGGDFNVVTTSPGKIKGRTAGAGRKGAVGLEDPGVFVTPEGEGSPAFLGIDGGYGREFTLNPVKPVRDALKNPTVTRFKAGDVRRLPDSVKSEPGFEPVGEFFDQRTPDRTVFITKRSEIGQGSTPRQRFAAGYDFDNPMQGLRVERDGESVLLGRGERVKAGDVITEGGTQELEGVVPRGQSFEYNPRTPAGRVKGFDEYTRIDGRLVRIRDADLVDESGVPSTDVESSMRGRVSRRTTGGRTLTSEQISSDLETPQPSSSPTRAAAASQPSVQDPTGSWDFPPGSVEISVEPSNLKRGSARGRGPVSPDYDPVSEPSSLKPSRTPISDVSGLSSSSGGSSSSSGFSSDFSSNPSTPSKPSKPSKPSTPSVPSTPSTPSKPSKPSTPSVPSTPLTPQTPRKPGPLSSPPRVKPEESGRDLFFPEVKREGSFQTVGGGFRDPFEAAQESFGVVERTPAATGRVVNRAGIPVDVGTPSGAERSLSESFSFVEPSKARIDTPGELFGITFEGVEASRSRKTSKSKKRSKPLYDEILGL